jgi:hypothetical protein
MGYEGLLHGGATSFFARDNQTSAVHSIPTALPRAGTRADETKRSKRSDPPAMGALDSDAADRSGRADRKGLIAILLRTRGRRIAAIGFPVPGAGQMADHSRLAVGCRAIIGPLDISHAAHGAAAQAAAGTSQIRRQDLKGNPQSDAASACTENIPAWSVQDSRTFQSAPRASAVKRSRLYL